MPFIVYSKQRIRAHHNHRYCSVAVTSYLAVISGLPLCFLELVANPRLLLIVLLREISFCMAENIVVDVCSFSHARTPLMMVDDIRRRLAERHRWIIHTRSLVQLEIVKRTITFSAHCFPVHVILQPPTFVLFRFLSSPSAQVLRRAQARLSHFWRASSPLAGWSEGW